jgi:hypothetical protein
MSISSVKTGAIGDSLLAGNAAYDPGAFVSIATATGTGSSGTITFSSIPSTYTSLQLRVLGRTTRTNTDSTLGIRFNNDTGSNYTYHYLSGSGASASAAGFTAQTASYNAVISGSTTASNVMGVAIIDVHDYTSTTRNKTIRTFTGWDTNNVTGGSVSLYSGLWLNTAAVNRIDLIIADGSNWASNAVFSLYGIKGA